MQGGGGLEGERLELASVGLETMRAWEPKPQALVVSGEAYRAIVNQP
jgi:hypothetical protein